jgi:hypothetical protein
MPNKIKGKSFQVLNFKPRNAGHYPKTFLIVMPGKETMLQHLVGSLHVHKNLRDTSHFIKGNLVAAAPDPVSQRELCPA